MGDHVVLNVDHLIVSEEGKAVHGGELSDSSFSSSLSFSQKEDCTVSEEEMPLIQVVECRICQEEDHIKNLEIPCSCSGSLKYAHRECVQRWCNEKGDIICEICHEPYKNGYTAPPRPPLDETTIDMSGEWAISSAPIDLRDPRILAMAAAQRHFLESEYDEYAATDASGAAFFRSAALILMALLLLRHALSMTTEGDDSASTYFSFFMLRAAGFLLPCYIMAWAISTLHRRRQRQEAEAAIAAAEVTFILQSGQRSNLHFTIAPETPATPQQEPPPSQ